MQVKRYEVATMNEGLYKIKNDLGPDAVILSARKIKNGRQEMFEIMAARDEDPTAFQKGRESKPETSGAAPSQRSEETIALFRNELAQIRKSVEAMQRQSLLGRELAEMRETMNSFFDVVGMRKGRAAQDLNSKIYLQLIGSGFSRASACRLVDAVNQKTNQPSGLTEADALDWVEKYIGGSLPAVNKNSAGERVKMFIGPTGVGKTTTLAKLAARYSIMNKKKVALITTDNFRIAAAEQLETYAKIMGLRMEKAASKEAFEKAVRRFADQDVILVDTPGRARPDDGVLNACEFVLPDQAVETHLLINATGSREYLDSVVSAYSRFRISSLIVTKIDESERFGMLYDVIAKTNKPVTYLTCGQNVPQDIEEVTPGRMANLMIGCAARGEARTAQSSGNRM